VRFVIKILVYLRDFKHSITRTKRVLCAASQTRILNSSRDVEKRHAGRKVIIVEKFTYAKTYDNRPKEVLEITAPTQSTLIRNFCQVTVSISGSFGRYQLFITNKRKINPEVM